MTYAVTLIPGEGVGPEVSAAARRVLDATGVSFDWQVCLAGGEVAQKYGTTLPDETLESIKRNKVALKGPIGTPIGTGFKSVNVELRQKLDLYANFRPARSIPGVKTRYDNVDLIVIRENTEGLYSGLEQVVVPGVVESFRIITERASERIVRYAFHTARNLRRKRVTAVHKANILKKSDGLFLDVARRIAKEFSDIGYDEAIVDATAMKLVMNPNTFDVLVMENLFGDILSDLTAGLIGGLGLAPSANIGEHGAIFEAVHGTAPDIAGKGLANPTATILSGVLMLRHLSEHSAAERLEAAVYSVLADGKSVTPDLGGAASTEQYADAIIERLQTA